jgi:hypothetical protein
MCRLCRLVQVIGTMRRLHVPSFAVAVAMSRRAMDKGAILV